MHSRLIVLVDPKISFLNGKVREELKTSKAIRKYTLDFLDKEGFGFQGKFASGWADWYQIGGRWSGTLTKVRLNPLLHSTCEERMEKEMGNVWNEKKIQKIFYEFFPKFKGIVPYGRSNSRIGKSLSIFGYEDDAQKVDKVLWNCLIRKEIKDCKGDGSEDSIVWTDGEAYDLKPVDVINILWAVIIDWHI